MLHGRFAQIAAVTLFVLSGAAATGAQPESELDLDVIQKWLKENIDEGVLAAVGEIDKQRIEALHAELTRRLQSTNVSDLAGLASAVKEALPLLNQFEEARPYVEWLQTHLDYFTTAEELQRTKPPKPGQNPSVETQQKIWTTELDKKPRPTRASSYVPELKPLFSAAGVPSALVWVAEVESSFIPTARSPVGAAGMFQLMPATARSLGLALTPEDERLDPHKSATAAAKYLRYLHRRFGDWRLALAAYNAGEGRVNALLNRAETRSYAAIATQLPAETQMYVPKIEATLRKREGVTLGSLH
jgi:membrane-bound lytic murein transglycosylase D